MKVFRFILLNLLVIGLLIGGALLILRLAYDSGGSSALPVDIPDTVARATSGEEVVSNGAALQLETINRISADDLPDDMKLSYRAREGWASDYLALSLRLQNGAEEPLALNYFEQGEGLKMLLGVRRPQPQTILPLPPDDAEQISQKTALEDGAMEPQSERSGVLVFPIREPMSELSLLALKPGDATLPAFEVGLPRD